MTKHNSPMFACGRERGELDTARISACPPHQPLGPEPPYPDYRVMYDRGYETGFDPGQRHVCGPECRRS